MNIKRAVRMNYSLLELLIVIGMLALFLTLVSSFFYNGMTLCRNFSSEVYSNSQILVMKNKWRKFVHQNPSAGMRVENDGSEILFSDGRSIDFSERELTFHLADNRSEPFRVARRMKVSFDIEKSENGNLAVMNIEIVPSVKRKNKEIVRVVAAPRQ